MENYRKFIAEAIGTFALVFIGAGAVCTDYYLKQGGGQGVGLLGISMAYGFAVIAAVYSLGYVSGCHINPAVTVACWITKRMEANIAVYYIGSQLVGAVVAGFILKVLFPDALKVYLGTTVLGAGVTPARGILMESIITFFLVYTVFATAVDPRAPRGFAGLAIGLVFLFGVMVGGPITGGSMNPARTFGPALASGYFSNHFVYWIGPILGGVVAGLVYEKIFAEKK